MSKPNKDTFQFFLPATVVKANKTGDGTRWIEGIASTADLDLQGERVVQDGIDFEYFLKNGYINNDHKEGPENKVGEPTEAKITKDGFWIKGFLYKGKEISDKWWEHLQSLDQSDSKRRVGFSIEGKVKRRAGKSILKCWIKDVAITAAPVNTSTWTQIVKSLCAEEWCDSMDKAVISCECGSEDDMHEHEEKETPKQEREEHEKALSVGGMGRSLVPQSLEGRAKVTTFKSLDDIPQEAMLSREECIKALQLDKGWGRSTASLVVDAIFTERKLNK